MALAAFRLYDWFTGSKPPSPSPSSSSSSSGSSSPVFMDEYVVPEGGLRKRGHKWNPVIGRHVPIGGNREPPQSFSQTVCSLSLVAKDSFRSSCRWLYSRDWSGYASKLRNATCYLGSGIKSLCLKMDSLVERLVGGQD